MKTEGKCYHIPASKQGEVIRALSELGFKIFSSYDSTDTNHTEIYFRCYYGRRYCAGFIEHAMAQGDLLITMRSSNHGRDIERCLDKLKI